MNKRVLLDENLSHKLRLLLTGHTVITTAYQGWAGTKNGELIKPAEDAAFDVMVTADQGANYQQNMLACKLALVVLSTNREKVVLANGPRILSAINESTVGSFTTIDLGY